MTRKKRKSKSKSAMKSHNNPSVKPLNDVVVTPPNPDVAKSLNVETAVLLSKGLTAEPSYAEHIVLSECKENELSDDEETAEISDTDEMLSLIVDVTHLYINKKQTPNDDTRLSDADDEASDEEIVKPSSKGDLKEHSLDNDDDVALGEEIAEPSSKDDLNEQLDSDDVASDEEIAGPSSISDLKEQLDVSDDEEASNDEIAGPSSIGDLKEQLDLSDDDEETSNEEIAGPSPKGDLTEQLGADDKASEKQTTEPSSKDNVAGELDADDEATRPSESDDETTTLLGFAKAVRAIVGDEETKIILGAELSRIVFGAEKTRPSVTPGEAREGSNDAVAGPSNTKESDEQLSQSKKLFKVKNVGSKKIIKEPFTEQEQEYLKKLDLKHLDEDISKNEIEAKQIGNIKRKVTEYIASVRAHELANSETLPNYDDKRTIYEVLSTTEIERLDPDAFKFLKNYRPAYIEEVYESVLIKIFSRRTEVITFEDIQHYLATKNRIWTLGFPIIESEFVTGKKKYKRYDLRKVRVSPIVSSLRPPKTD